MRSLSISAYLNKSNRKDIIPDDCDGGLHTRFVYLQESRATYACSEECLPMKRHHREEKVLINIHTGLHVRDYKLLFKFTG